MSAVELASLPADVVSALRAAFGDGRVEDPEMLSGGKSQAMLLAFTVGGAPFVLKRIPSDRAAVPHACMRLAGERGVGPRVVYADDATGVCVMERVQGKMLRTDRALASGRVERVASALRRLHDGPAFPPAPTLPESLARFDAQSRALTGQGVPAEIAEAVERVAPLVTHFDGTAPCHRDLNPNNILETADRAVFVDWDTAGQGDPYLDLAQLGVFAFAAPPEREALLEAYLGRPATDGERARSTVARVRALAFYALAFRQVQALAGEVFPEDAPVPALPELFATIATRRENTSPGLLARSLQREMRETLAGEAYAAASAAETG